jgi:hypothetical protein
MLLSSSGKGETLSEKLNFSENFFLVAKIYFGIFFLHKKFILETYLLALKRFRKTTNELGDLNMIY